MALLTLEAITNFLQSAFGLGKFVLMLLELPFRLVDLLRAILDRVLSRVPSTLILRNNVITVYLFLAVRNTSCMLFLSFLVLVLACFCFSV